MTSPGAIEAPNHPVDRNHMDRSSGEQGCWLRCQVLPGLFGHERLVLILDASGQRVASFVADRQLVHEEGEPRRGAPVPGHVKVLPISVDALATVHLPVQSIEKGYVISVPAEYLE
jgi:hypothetical protein